MCFSFQLTVASPLHPPPSAAGAVGCGFGGECTYNTFNNVHREYTQRQDTYTSWNAILICV